MRHKDVWTFEYRGVTIEINRWQFEGTSDFRFENNWNYYLWLHLKRIPEPFKNQCWINPKPYRKGERAYCRYSETWLNNLSWHYGCTYYSQTLTNGVRGDRRVIQVGCDYQHSWDEGMTYDENWLANDAKETVDSMFEIFPYLQWCRRCGSLNKENEDCEKCKEEKIVLDK